MKFKVEMIIGVEADSESEAAQIVTDACLQRLEFAFSFHTDVQPDDDNVKDL